MTRSARQSRKPSIRALLLAVLLALGGLMAMPVRAAADGPTTFSNTTPILIPSAQTPPTPAGPASPYPSNVTVSGMTGAITNVTVTFHNLSHGSVNDIDAMLVAPDGSNLLLLSDIGDVTPPTFPNAQLVTATNIDLTFADGAGAVPRQVILPTDTYRPTNQGSGTDSFTSPAPAPSTQTTLGGAFSGLTGGDLNGTWSLYVVDDTGGDQGSMAGGWSLTVTTASSAVATTTDLTSSDVNSTTGQSVTFTARVETTAGDPVTTGTVWFVDETTSTNLGLASPNPSGVATISNSSLAEGNHLIRATYDPATGFITSNDTLTQRVDNATVVTGTTFCNPGTITIPTQGTATPYPSNIFVTGLAGQVTKVTAQLRGLTHDEPTDVDVLLSGPTAGRNLVLLSDAGGTNNSDAPRVDNQTITFDDDASTGVPIPLASGTYEPTDNDPDGAVDTFPSAPTPVSATSLATFNGVSGNGTWSLWVVDDASGDGGSIAGGWCLTIESQVATDTVLTAVPSSSIFGQSVTFTAAVTADGSPVDDGNVEFRDGATLLDTVAVDDDGTASLTTSALTVGTHPITATYVGTDTYGESAYDLSYVVGRRPTMTTVTSSANPSDVGELVTFTATVTDAGDPVTTGTVQFSIDGASVGGPLTPDPSGQVTYQTSSLAAGTHSVAAVYSGTTTRATSTGTLDGGQEVQLLQPIGTLTADPTSSQVNQPVTLTATFTVDGAGATPGTVDFTDGGTDIPGCTDIAVDPPGVARCTVTFTTAATHQIAATFAQTATYAETTATLGYVVGLIPTSIVLETSGSPSDVGDEVTFTATVSRAEGGTPVTSGTVEFREGATLLGTDTPDAEGHATLSTDTLSAGSHQIIATYLANDTYAESTSNVVSQVVGLIESTTTVTTTPNPSDPNQPVTITATAVSGRALGDPTPTGTVTFTIDGGTPVQATLDASGVATITDATLAIGTHTIVATYGGDSMYATSTGYAGQGVRPIADAGGPYEIAEGGSLTLDGSDSTDGVSYAWDLNGDNDFTDASGETPTLTWDELQALGIDDGPGAYPVRLRVSISGVGSEPADGELTVTNTAPTSVLTGGLAATVAVPFTIKVGANDPSAADLAAQFTYTVDWGDGSPVVSVPGPADPPVTHVYVAAGDYNATFTATDKDGGTGPGTQVVITAEAAQVVTPSPTPTTTNSSDDDNGDNGDNSDNDGDDTSGSDSQLASTGSTVGLGTLVVSLVLLGGGLGLLLEAGRRRRTDGPRHR